jgi:hypothetical protein
LTWAINLAPIFLLAVDEAALAFPDSLLWRVFKDRIPRWVFNALTANMGTMRSAVTQLAIGHPIQADATSLFVKMIGGERRGLWHLRALFIG